MKDYTKKELKLLTKIEFIQLKKISNGTYSKRLTNRQLRYIRFLLKENVLEQKIIDNLIENIKESERYKQYNISGREFSKMLREKHISDNLSHVIDGHIEKFRIELLYFEKQLMKENNSYKKEDFENQLAIIENLKKILSSIHDEEKSIMKYFTDIKDLKYDKRIIKTGQFFAKIIGTTMFKIKLEGIKNIPLRGPVILAPHHVHSHFDPLLLKAVIPRKLHFISSAETFFAYPFTKWLFYKLGALPFYRDKKHFGKRVEKEKGEKEFGKPRNRRTIINCLKLLKYGGCVVIFPEGDASVSGFFSQGIGSFLRSGEFIKPQLGFVYFSVAAKKKYGTNVPIVPIGIKYKNRMHTNVEIKIGKPVYIPPALVKYPWRIMKKKLVDYAALIFEKIKKLS